MTEIDLEEEISGSQKLAKLLNKEHIGFKFTAKQLQRIALAAGHKLSEGVVTGFIVRARNKGMIDVARYSLNTKSKSTQIYQLVSKIEWKFHGPGIGSLAGRVLHKNVSPQGELPLVQPEGGNDLERAYVDDHLNIMRAVSGKDDPYGLVNGETSDGFKLHYEPNSLTDRLVQIAIEVNQLENQTVKTLDEFTIEEILEHLKTRLK